MSQSVEYIRTGLGSPIPKFDGKTSRYCGRLDDIRLLYSGKNFTEKFNKWPNGSTQNGYTGDSSEYD